MHAHDLSDIRLGDWVSRRVPSTWQPFFRLARLDRPVGIWLTLFPCWAALIQAAGGFPPIGTLIVFSLGALLMRSAGCTINDMADRKFDGFVERTRLRPLASGQIKVAGAVVFLAVQLALSASLLFYLAPQTRLLAVCVVPLVFLYPFCKRFTYWPQVVLGAAFNWGMLMAWSEIKGHLNAGAVLMWVGAVAWQVGYDTIYAYVDRRDDLKLGLKSTAIRFGDSGKACIGVLYGIAVISWWVGGKLAGMSELYSLGMLALAVHLGWQAYRLDLSRPALSFRVFLTNIATAVLLAGSAWIGTW